ncbi:hypothetical protein EJ04DRAFT_516302 [Polyplosphaeria fusca]|uniref:Uncharacterized protein n=1 Tax=Polyplosphaeria fusca TaxID=682080 RepID=A0A9P4UY71_9PLEO|nr:hypothetical protein EJ04DRAFT_516302 [Polyplosphaeria fusca]
MISNTSLLALVVLVVVRLPLQPGYTPPRARPDYTSVEMRINQAPKDNVISISDHDTPKNLLDKRAIMYSSRPREAGTDFERTMRS